MKTLDNIKGNSAAVTMLDKAVTVLEEIGFIAFLREKAQPVIINLGENETINATQGMRSAGYHDCINDLIYFKERYVYPEKDKEAQKLVPDYGGKKDSIEKGYLTEEEANGI